MVSQGGVSSPAAGVQARGFAQIRAQRDSSGEAPRPGSAVGRHGQEPRLQGARRRCVAPGSEAQESPDWLWMSRLQNRKPSSHNSAGWCPT